ncbi:hypothetical protein [Couchioplanes azureus]|uniref:hypothetical protein n=1 Tax=Couchioplanes caeruleus TaxID=56438 RepID=UPI001670A01C|nr:hypothetical protein [Couchioplanes caeruleus]GGQ74898.1 hypothetical protein GCM10010166_51050 [Couchioplanes caeruleus subsp. azureus]
MIGSWFATDFDAPATVLDLPVEVTSGQHPGVRIVDQVVRGAAIVGRLTGDCGGVVLKVRGGAGPVVVTVELNLDETATRWWADRVRPPRHAPERPRLVLLRCQGAVRGAAVLARRQGWRRATAATTVVEFELAAGELAPDGLLVVELAEPPVPPWARDRVSPRGAVGLRIERIRVRPRPAGPAAVTPAPSETGCDLAVLPPGPARRIRLAAGLVPPAPPVARSPANRWTRQKPARAVFKVSRLARRAALHAAGAPRIRRVAPPTVRATLLGDAAPAPVTVLRRGPGFVEVELTAPVSAPVLLGLADPDPRLALRITQESRR